MPATQGKEKLNPGDLVTLDPNVYLTDTVEYYGLGLYLEFKNGYHWVYWFKLTHLPGPFALGRAHWLIKVS